MNRHRLGPARRSPRRRGERGAVSAWFVLALPAFLLVLALVADVGRFFVLHSLAQSAADLGALAGVQELDLERLAEGERRLRTWEAEAAARAVADANAREALAGDRYDLESLAINADAGAPRRHPWSGRLLRDPTVSVRIRVRAHSFFLAGREVPIRVQGDASVMERPGFWDDPSAGTGGGN
ncbi:MAG: pilus assembly protein [Bacillota bacterium]|nr:pilus assembly protein [Bacillota bacterium]